MEKYDISLVGVGGQGILTAAELLAKCAMLDNHNVRVGEIHGMAQRGGIVQSAVRIGKDVYGPIISEGMADLIIGFEPVETLRGLSFASEKTIVLLNEHIVYPTVVSMGEASYPDMDHIKQSISKFTNKLYSFNAMDLALKAGAAITMNLVLLGAAFKIGNIGLNKDTMESVITNTFPERFKETNLKAFNLGYKYFK